MELAAWYHIYADGAWRQPLAEFQEAVRDSRFYGPTYYGIVGEHTKDVFSACPYLVNTYMGGEGGTNEAFTINALRDYAERYPSGAILYAHTKGSATVEPFRDRWRRSMTRRVVRNWAYCLALLDHELPNGPQAVGCHWLTEEQYPGMFGPMTIPTEGSGFFGGNFWMARCDYLRTLPPCEAEPRWKAESWIGINKPRVVDLLPGWPHDRRWPELCE